MTFAFHPEAEDEFKDAIAYYENCDAGLGFDFAREVYARHTKCGWLSLYVVRD